MVKTFGDWLKVLVLFLDEAAVLALVFLLLHFWGVRVPLLTTILVMLLVAIPVFIIHIKVIPSFHWKPVTGREGMLGLQGRVVQPLTPIGTIYVKGENWQAETTGEDIEVAETIEVVGVEGLRLRVIRRRGIKP